MGRPLRFETQNVFGMRNEAKLASLVKGWVLRESDVICLQETHIGWFDSTRYANSINRICRRVDPQHHGFHVLWGFNTTGNTNRSAGVAILLRRALITSGELAFWERDMSTTNDGRFLAVPVTWLGERFYVVSIHLPCASFPATQVQHIYSRLGPIAAAPGFWGGDWNFVANTQLDRLSVHVPAPPAQQIGAAAPALGLVAPGGAAAAAVGAQQQPIHGPAVPRPERAFADVAPQMNDCFRVLHPLRRCYTWHGVGMRSGQASRIDRWFCSSKFCPYLLHCDAKSPSVSDHRPVVVVLTPLHPCNMGKGYRRARPHQFWSDAAAKQSFVEFATNLVGEAQNPADVQQAQALLQWWPGAKLKLLKECCRLSLQVRAAQQAQAAVQGADASAELEAAYTAVEIFSSPARLEASIRRVVRARRAWRKECAADYDRAEWQARRDWVHSREQASRGLTAALAAQHPPEAKLIPALRSPATGTLVAHGRPLAQLMATYQANISKASPRNEESVQEVVDAVTSSTFKLSREEAEGIGSMEIDEAEVKGALKHSKPGTAPGLDGLPVELYRKCGDIFVPLFAKIYTAIGITQSLPSGLLDGVISSIYKKGQRSDPANYRPITVLNTDYRLLAKVLANRLKGVIGKLVHPAQTGFVPGRHIGENLLLNQLLPAALGPSSKAAAVCCDFRKAYDTVDRSFLYRVMEAQGIGSGFIKWVKLLLTNTSACACINGHISSLVPFTAGVRQGCPLAPYLYLLVTQAIHCFLSSKGFGVQVEGKRLVASMYADDSQAYINDVFTDLGAFKSAMKVIEEASNQTLSIPKSFVLVIGKGARRKLWTDHYMSQLRLQRPYALEAQLEREAVQLAQAALVHDKASIPPDIKMHGFNLVSEVTSLGILLRADGTVQADWSALLDKVKSAYTFLSRLNLSNFGRAFAAASYGVSKVSYAAEFTGLPPADVINELEKISAKLVDRGLAPDVHKRAFAGVRAQLLAGHPRTGGFGAMPWREHIIGRHAVWGIRMMTGSSDTPWIYVARRLLCPLGTTCAAWQRLGIAMCGEEGYGPSNKHINPCLVRLAEGLRALPQWQHGNSFGLDPGPWCANMPLWCNPFICTTGRPGPLPSRGLEAQFEDLANIASFCTLKDALLALDGLHGGTLQAAAYQQWVIWWLRNSPGFICQDHTYRRLKALVDAIPACWKAAVNIHALGVQPSSEEIVVTKFLPKIQWLYPRSSVPVGLSQLKVKQATKLQLGPLMEARAVKQMSFLSEAVVGMNMPLGCNGISPDSLPPLYKQLWGLPWDNKKKVVYWLLTHNGLPTAERLGKTEETCYCGVQMPGRAHHFWDCPVALAVRGEIERALSHNSRHVDIERHHVWLMHTPPCRGLHRGVWLVACLSALLAMHTGMRLLTRWRLHTAQEHERAPPPEDERIGAASRVAIASFWDELQDFISLGLAPATWISEITNQHPLIKVSTRAGGERKLALHKV